MEKAIIILDGCSEGKTKFNEILKNNNYWIWNVNHLNVLSMVSHKVGWDGVRDKSYYNFIQEFEDLTKKYFDFERNYTIEMIEKFKENSRVNILIIHNCDGKLAVELQDFYTNCFDILISSENKSEEDCTYCKTLNYNSETFDNDVLSVVNILTKSFDKEN